jgi:hypothetical protein
MSHYIVCYRKRNNPRMDIRVCEQKCPVREDCKEFTAHRDQQPDASPSAQPETAELKAA